jgi:fatty acid desaturase
MRTRMYEPLPDEVRELPADRRRYVFRTVRNGEAVEKRKEAKAAVAMAEWMLRQRDTSTLQLLLTPISLIAIGALLFLGFISTGNVLVAIFNVIPFIAIMFAIRGFAYYFFRKAPDAHEANLDRLQRRKRR